jgi:hypothetical protein
VVWIREEAKEIREQKVEIERESRKTGRHRPILVS